MLRPVLILLMLLASTGCNEQAGEQTLAQARAGFVTKLTKRTQDMMPTQVPPKGMLELVHYPAPPGMFAGYLTPRPKTPGKHPAIIWITGGDNASGDFLWKPQDPGNDQSAAVFRKAGIVTFYPSVRGGNDNPGYREGFMGEVDDILAAREWLAKQDYIDPDRIYLGGHSTGGTLVMLVAEMSDQFRAVFAFGPADDVRRYGGDHVYADLNDDQEVLLRSPGYWLASVRKPLLVFEGAAGFSDSLETMRKDNRNSMISFYEVPRHDHFSVLKPASALIAQKILAEARDGTPVAFTQTELDSLQ